MNVSLLDLYNQISIHQYKTDIGFRSLVEGVHDNLYVIPEYQRKFRWNKKQVEELAASLIRDLPIPPIYTFRNKNEQLEILDGQQRAMSLYFYYIGKFFRAGREAVFDYSDLDVENARNFEEALQSKYHNIVPTKFLMEIDDHEYDISYATLPIQLRRKIDYRTISVIEIKASGVKNLDITLHKIFTNLNNGGKRLSPQELRNGIYPCSFSRMIKLLNKENKKWRELYGREDDECKDIELLYRFCALKKFVEYDGKEFRIHEYSNSMENFIDYFSEEAFNFSIKEIEGYKKQLEEFINSLSVSRKFFRKKTLIEGFFVIFSKTDLNKIKFTDTLSEQILNDTVMEETRNGRTTSSKVMNKRWRRMYEILSGNVK